MTGDGDDRMPAADAQREALDTRRIEVNGFRRSDALFEIESRVVDSKPRDFVPHSSDRAVPAGASIHDMGVRLVFDATLRVVGVATFMHATPYAECAGGGLALRALAGFSITDGWSREVHVRLRGGCACTHLRELLVLMATAAFQSLSALRQGASERVDAQGRPLKFDTCHVHAAGSELVRRRWPDFRRAAFAASAPGKDSCRAYDAAGPIAGRICAQG